MIYATPVSGNDSDNRWKEPRAGTAEDEPLLLELLPPPAEEEAEKLF